MMKCEVGDKVLITNHTHPHIGKYYIRRIGHVTKINFDRPFPYSIRFNRITELNRPTFHNYTLESFSRDQFVIASKAAEILYGDNNEI